MIHEIEGGSLAADTTDTSLEVQYEPEMARQPHVEFVRWVGDRAYKASLALDHISAKHIMPNLLMSEQHQQAFIAATMASADLRHAGKFMHMLGNLTQRESDEA